MDYELVVLVRNTENQEPYKKKFSELLKKEGIDILGDITWESKTLAYPIQKHQSANFLTVKIKSVTGTVNSLPAKFKLEETILRYLFLKIKPPKNIKAKKVTAVS